MKIKFWGVRGSIPSPLTGTDVENKIRKTLALARAGDISSAEAIDHFITTLPFSLKSTYGGNTTCIQVTTSGGDHIILDCGSGLHNLGRELLKGDFSKGKGMASIILSHTHWDHIQGIPFFAPLYFEGNRFNFYSPYSDLKERFELQHTPTHFPIMFDYMPATKEFFTISYDEEFYINDTRIFVKKMPHPGSSIAIRIDDRGKSFVFTSDCEFNVDSVEGIDSYALLFRDADVVCFDTQYTFEESINKLDWGHSSTTIAIDIASMFNAKKLLMFHHDPDYNDEKLENVLANAKTYQRLNRRRSGQLDINIASEGMEITL